MGDGYRLDGSSGDRSQIREVKPDLEYKNSKIRPRADLRWRVAVSAPTARSSGPTR
jgi:hypothetical protein